MLRAIAAPEDALACLKSAFAPNTREVHDGATHHLLVLNASHSDSALHFVHQPDASEPLAAFAVRREPATGRAPEALQGLENVETALAVRVVYVLSHHLWVQSLP